MTAVLARQPRQGAGLGESKPGVVAGLPNRLGKEDGTERPGRQEYDLPLREVRCAEPGGVGLRKGRRRTKDQLGSAHRGAGVGRDELERRRAPAAVIPELER